MAAYSCPHCKQPICDDDALLCLYCGESLERGRRFPVPKAVMLVLVILLLLAFVLAMVF